LEKYQYSPISSDDSQVDLIGEFDSMENFPEAGKLLPVISDIDIRMEIIHASNRVDTMVAAKCTAEKLEYDRIFWEGLTVQHFSPAAADSLTPTHLSTQLTLHDRRYNKLSILCSFLNRFSRKGYCLIYMLRCLDFQSICILNDIYLYVTN